MDSILEKIRELDDIPELITFAQTYHGSMMLDYNLAINKLFERLNLASVYGILRHVKNILMLFTSIMEDFNTLKYEKYINYYGMAVEKAQINGHINVEAYLLRDDQIILMLPTIRHQCSPIERIQRVKSMLADAFEQDINLFCELCHKIFVASVDCLMMQCLHYIEKLNADETKKHLVRSLITQAVIASVLNDDIDTMDIIFSFAAEKSMGIDMDHVLMEALLNGSSYEIIFYLHNNGCVIEDYCTETIHLALDQSKSDCVDTVKFLLQRVKPNKEEFDLFVKSCHKHGHQKCLEYLIKHISGLETESV